MKRGEGFEFPPDKRKILARARRLEWITIGYLLSVTALMALVLGQSQAMKAAWIEDALSLVPAIVFLVGVRISQWEPSDRFPWGWHRASSAAHLAAAAALFVVGSYLFAESSLKLARAEHPTIGTMTVFGWQVWQGWPMIAVLVYSLVPAAVLGRLKEPLAHALYDKTLYTDAKMQKADWMTAGAAIVGILAIGFGFWWADAVAAILISLDILRDGAKQMTMAVLDLMDETPRTVDGRKTDPVVSLVERTIRDMPWVEQAEIRLRVNGHVLSGEATVTPASTQDLPARIEDATRAVLGLDWRLHHFAIVALPRPQESERRRRSADQA